MRGATVTAASALAWVALLGGCGEAGDSDRQTAGQMLANEVSTNARAAAASQRAPQAFADAVAGDAAYAVATGKLAQQMARRPEVKDFAAQTVQDYTVTGEELRDALGGTHGLAETAQIAPDRQRELDRLRHAGDDFDKLYLRRQIATDEQELARLRDYADNGQDPALSGFAADAVNAVADHLRQARQLS